jgi:hypothetical protein
MGQVIPRYRSGESQAVIAAAMGLRRAAVRRILMDPGQPPSTLCPNHFAAFSRAFFALQVPFGTRLPAGA